MNYAAHLEEAAEEYRNSTGWDMSEGHAIKDGFIAGATYASEVILKLISDKAVPDDEYWKQVNADPTNTVLMMCLNAKQDSAREIMAEIIRKVLK